MAKYSIYANLFCNHNNQEEIIDVMNKFVVQKDGFRFFYSIPYLNCVPFLLKKSFVYSLLMLLMSFAITLLSIKTFTIYNPHEGGYIEVEFFRLFILICFSIIMGHCGGILERKTFKKQGLKLVFEAVEKNKQRFLKSFYKSVSLVQNGVVVKNELLKSISDN